MYNDSTVHMNRKFKVSQKLLSYYPLPSKDKCSDYILKSYDTFAIALKYGLEITQLCQKDIANHLKLDKSVISRWCSGDKPSKQIYETRVIGFLQEKCKEIIASDID